ncbi:MAG: tRNA lysidine(34) synthetase TilS [Gemmatimonadetes bacterium]|nr:tRNA lysidine(34) synthetase TilS [Gemmatimonadota bacterium]
MSDLAARLLAHIREAVLFPRPGLGLLAVSGGADSVALLDLVSIVAPEVGLELAVAHVDHGIHPESSAVAARVRDLAAAYGLPACGRTLGLGPDASETRAREHRYRALRELQQELGADYLVTAHHADDQIETVLFRFLRGSAPAGLAGITGLGPDGLVRPLLPFRRAELEEWLSFRYPNPAIRPPVFQDPANRDPRHDRSWLRERVLPLLRERFGEALDANLRNAQRHAERDRDAWASLLRVLPELDFRWEALGVDVARAPLRTYDKALSETLLRAVAREAGCVLGPGRAAKLRDLVERGPSGRVLELGAGWHAETAFDRLRIQRAGHTAPESEAWGATNQGSVRWGGWQFSWRAEPAGAAVRGGLTTWVPPGVGEIRAAASGDRIFPLGGVGRRSVSRLLMEARVPRSERLAYPVLSRGQSLLWVPAVCRAAQIVPRPGEASLRIDAHRA